MAKLVYVCDWLPPDFGSVGQYSLQFSQRYAEAGRDVVLVGLTSERSSETREDYGAGSLTLLRVHAGPFDRAHLLRRLVWALGSNFRILRAAWRHLRTADEILFTACPPLMLHFLVPLNLLLRKKLTYRITDFHPECLIVTMSRVPLSLRAFLGFTRFLRRRVDSFQVLGEDQRRRLRESAIAEERIVLKRDPAPVTVKADDLPLGRPAGLSDRVVLLYSGNFGVAHDVDTFVEGYRRHHELGSGRIALWLNATGVLADTVEQRLREAGLPVVRTHLVPLDQVARLLVTPDAHLVTLRDAFVGYVMPSKIYGCIDSCRHILYVGSRESDVHLLCNAGVVDGALYLRADVGDANAVGAALDTLAERCDGRAQRVRIASGA